LSIRTSKRSKSVAHKLQKGEALVTSVNFLRHEPGEGYHFEVPSAQEDVIYKVILKGHKDSVCTCPSFLYQASGEKCKHLHACYLFMSSHPSFSFQPIVQVEMSWCLLFSQVKVAREDIYEHQVPESTTETIEDPCM
jgi:hypothetical protein